MDWQRLQEDLPVLFGTLLDLPCQWLDQPQKVYTTAHAELDLLHPEGVGVDDRFLATVHDDVTGLPIAVADTVSGNREIIAQLTVISLNQRLDKSARYYLDRMQMRMRWLSSIASLADLGLAFVKVESFVEVDPTQESRAISQSVLEIRFAYVHSEADAPAPFIETARVSSNKLRNTAGAELPAGEQIDITGPEVI